MSDPETEAEPDTVDACPECDGTRPYHRDGKRGGRMDDTAPTAFRCRDCGAEFDDPETRPAKQHTDTVNGLARRLADANPEEVLGE